jgi:hypothetical protein
LETYHWCVAMQEQAKYGGKMKYISSPRNLRV